MADDCQQVLFISLPSSKELRAAVARIIRRVQADKELTDEALADAIGTSASTIRNARNETADLSARFIAGIGKRYGTGYVQPYADLMDGQIMPMNAREGNPVPALGSAIAKLSVVRTERERRDALPEAMAARDALNAFISRAEGIAA